MLQQCYKDVSIRRRFSSFNYAILTFLFVFVTQVFALSNGLQGAHLVAL